MENILTFFTDNINFLILGDSVFLLILFFSFVANKRQGFKNINLDPLIYFSLLKYLFVFLESYLFNFQGDYSAWIPFFYLVVGILSGVYLLIFASKLAPLGNSIYYLILFSLLSIGGIVQYYYGYTYSLLGVYYLFIVLCYFLVGWRVRRIVWNEDEYNIKIAMSLLFFVSLLDPTVSILGYFYLYQGLYLKYLSIALLVRFLATAILSFSVFILYASNHLRQSAKRLIIYGVFYTTWIKLIIVFIVVSLLLFSFFSLKYYQELDIETTINDIDAHLDTAYSSVKGKINVTEGSVMALSGSPVFEKGIISGSSLSSTLDRYASILDGTVVYVMDKNGNVIDSSNRNSPDSFVGKNYSVRPYFIKAMAEFPGGDYDYVAMGLTSNIAGYYVAHPIKNSAGEKIGVAVIKLNLDSTFSSKNQGECYFLSDEDGIILASDCKEIVLRMIVPVSLDIVEKKILRKQYPTINPDYIAPFINETYDEEGDMIYRDKDIIILRKQIDEPLFIGSYIKGPVPPRDTYLIFFAMEMLSFFSLVVFFTKIFDHQTAESIEKREKDALSAKNEAENEKKELERMNKFMIGRELKMIELKKQVKDLEDRVAEK